MDRHPSLPPMAAARMTQLRYARAFFCHPEADGANFNGFGGSDGFP